MMAPRNDSRRCALFWREVGHHQKGGPNMTSAHLDRLVKTVTGSLSRRAAVRRLIVGGGAAALAGRSLDHAAAQGATPAAGECVATAPPLRDGIGFAQLL